MKVIATARGYDNVTLREEGDVFDMPDGAKGSWFKPLKEPKKGTPSDGKPNEPGKEPSASDLA